MKTQIFVRRSRIEAPAEEVYAWHALPEALQKLTPPGKTSKFWRKREESSAAPALCCDSGRWPFDAAGSPSIRTSCRALFHRYSGLRAVRLLEAYAHV